MVFHILYNSFLIVNKYIFYKHFFFVYKKVMTNVYIIKWLSNTLFIYQHYLDTIIKMQVMFLNLNSCLIKYNNYEFTMYYWCLW